MEKTDVEVAKSLIRFYNSQASCSISSTSSTNQEVVFACLERTGNDPILVKNHIRKWAHDHYFDANLSKRFQECLEAMPVPLSVEAEEAKTSLDLIGQTVASIVAKTQADKIEQAIMSTLHDDIRDFIMKEYGPIERKITTYINDVPHDTHGLLHEQFDTVLKFVERDEPVFLTGPAGSGKNFLCKQIADTLNLDFYFSNAVTQEYKLTGFTDAMGNYQPTQFYKAFTEGGLFMLDEIDASIPEVLVILNAAIANRYFDFPAPIGYKKAHPNFRVVAAGNTTGRGADYEYVGRNQLDGASLDRFAIVEIDYSKSIEDGLAVDNELANFCREFRNAAKKVGVGIIVSYRAISRLAKMIPIMSLEEALKTCLVKDLEKDDLNIITKELHGSRYKSALQNIGSNM